MPGERACLCPGPADPREEQLYFYSLLWWPQDPATSPSSQTAQATSESGAVWEHLSGGPEGQRKELTFLSAAE